MRFTLLLGFYLCLLSSGCLLEAEPFGPGLAFSGTMDRALILRFDEERAGVRRLVWESPHDRLELTLTPVSDERAAAGLVADREHLLAAVFEQPYSTYKLGPMSERRCPDGLRPTPVDLSQQGLKGTAFFLASTRDFVYGGCSSESTDLVSAYANFWCPGALHVIELRSFSGSPQARRQRQDLISSLRCLDTK